ncbi:MAG: excinuclease ABC subunit UvrA, partial [Planctomycetes bacterium]|nr:excinuclease ABC subunit UvrA [Planctomycetota bacterium]
VESLSIHARSFQEQLHKPDVESIEGLPPTVAVSQRHGSPGPRSTVATSTELYDFFRLLFARVGRPHCPGCGGAVRSRTVEQVTEAIVSWPDHTRYCVLAPYARAAPGRHQDTLRRMQREGFVRARVDGQFARLDGDLPLAPEAPHTIDAVVDRNFVAPGARSRVAESVELAYRVSGGFVTVLRETGEDQWAEETHAERPACRACGIVIGDLTPKTFSFNAPEGACAACHGLGAAPRPDPDLVAPAPALSLAGGAIAPWRGPDGKLDPLFRPLAEAFCARAGVSLHAAFSKMPEEARQALLFGAPAADGAPAFEGVIPALAHRFEKARGARARREVEPFLADFPCAACGGARLSPVALAVRVGGRNIAELCAMTVAGARDFIAGLALAGDELTVARPVLAHVISRLDLLLDVGLAYLTLDRLCSTLSGGEAQRIRLATQIAGGLAGVCYVLDEPTTGLHPRDTERLIAILRRIRDAGNTVIVVEHDADVLRAADLLVDMGPGAGGAGGDVIYRGPVEKAAAEPRSLTGRYLAGALEVATPARRRPASPYKAVEVVGATEHNLKDLRVKFPAGVFTCVTGVSGSGKSTLVGRVLLAALRRRLQRSGPRPGAHRQLLGVSCVDNVVEISQTSIGRTPRSNAATHTGAFDEIRRLFAATKEARIRGYHENRFSFNVKGGRCETCRGQGTRRVEMHFLPDVFVTCEACGGSRYNRETREVRWRGVTIADVLNLRVDEALRSFDRVPELRRLLEVMKSVGLAYLPLGQPASTFSGGEAQRVKLAAELAGRQTGRTLYVLDEPTTGLHPADVARLLDVLGQLVDHGNTVVVIEHNLDVIRAADWIIDLGPEGGEHGGRVVAEGTPEEVAAAAASHTGRFLAQALARGA